MALSIGVRHGEDVLIGEALVTVQQHPRKPEMLLMRIDAPRSVQVIRSSAKQKGVPGETQPTPART